MRCHTMLGIVTLNRWVKGKWWGAKTKQWELKEHQLLWGMLNSSTGRSGGASEALSNTWMVTNKWMLIKGRMHCMVKSISMLDPDSALTLIQMVICDMSKMLAQKCSVKCLANVERMSHRMQARACWKKNIKYWIFSHLKARKH